MGRRTETWRRRLRVDPVPALLSCRSEVIAFFTARDLLEARASGSFRPWTSPAARRIIAAQGADGSWKYPGRRTRPEVRYEQLETLRQLSALVEKYGLSREHPAVERGAEALFSSQTESGDFRGIYGRQHATPYMGAMLEVLVKAGYQGDPRVARGFSWLLSMRQDDGGWAIPLRTVGASFAEILDAERHPSPVGHDRTRPFSHLVTGMVLRAFAAHPRLRGSTDARRAGELLTTRLFAADAYPDRRATSFWERVSFPFWFTDIVSVLDTLARLELSPSHPAIANALERVLRAQRADGTFRFKLLKDRDEDLPWWICLAVCRSLKRWFDSQ